MTWRPRFLVLHHSAGNETLEQLAALNYYHHVVADEPGGPRMLSSVPIDRGTKFAVAGGNSQCYSVCVVGNFETADVSLELLRFLVQIFAARCKAWKLDPGFIVSHGWYGRNRAYPRYSTQCCGRKLEANLSYIRAQVRGYVG